MMPKHTLLWLELIIINDCCCHCQCSASRSLDLFLVRSFEGRSPPAVSSLPLRSRKNLFPAPRKKCRQSMSAVWSSGPREGRLLRQLTTVLPARRAQLSNYVHTSLSLLVRGLRRGVRASERLLAAPRSFWFSADLRAAALLRLLFLEHPC